MSPRTPRGIAPRILSAGIVVVRATPAGHEVLLLRVYNYWDFPKGVVDAGEDPFDAARREVREETGIADLDFHWGDAFIETEPYAKNKVARYYLARTATASVSLGLNPELGRAEHHEARWMSFAQARALVVPRLQRVLDWAKATMS